jgi:Zn finger protein HypA/HybF involved in hydrogenase expression
MNQFICQTCDAEYEIVTESDEVILYCPFCGSLQEEVDLEEDETDEDWDNQDRDNF